MTDNRAGNIGDSGKCYTGPDAKKRAAEQGAAIKISQKSKGQEVDMSDINELAEALETTPILLTLALTKGK